MPSTDSTALVWIRRSAALVAAAVGIYYITWRLLVTLNPHALWFAIPLWVAEAYGLISSLLFFYTVWDTRPRRSVEPPPEGLRVDVLVPTYNEPVWLLRRTLVGALAMRHPHRTHLLDDGHRPEMAELARELGCGYISRPDNLHAKAGNLNWALTQTDGDVIAVFDADHVPLPHFLERTLGYFRDPRVAFVQTPQEYYNVESFQHRTDVSSGRTWHEQSLFYHVIQPGKDHWNASFFCGSCGLMRRSALEEVGGFATESITEDMHTSVRLHAHGWSSVYHDEVLALGLAAQTALPYHVQRLRWGQGTMQVLRRERILRDRGLTWHQKINYLASGLHYFDGFQRLFLYLAPPLCVATGVLPVRNTSASFFLHVLAYYASAFAAFKLAGRGHSVFGASERFHMIRFFTYIRSCTALVLSRPLRFRVSPKTAPGRADRSTVLPVVAVGVYVLGCVTAGFVRVFLGHDDNAVAFWGNVVWSAWTVGLVVAALRLTLDKTEIRSTPRAQAGLPVRWRSAAARGMGVLVDVSEGGAAVLVPAQPPLASDVHIELVWPGCHLDMTGDVTRVAQRPHGTLVGLSWAVPSGEEAVNLAALAGQLTARHHLFDLNRPWDRLGALRLHRGRRRPARRALVLPVLMEGAGADCWAVTHDVSDEGALLVAPTAMAVGDRVALRRWDGAAVTGTVVRCDEVTLPPGRAWRLGVRVDQTLEARAVWQDMRADVAA